MEAETNGADGLHSLADGVALGDSCGLDCGAAGRRDEGGAVAPTEVAPSAGDGLIPFHYLELTDAEFMHILFCVEQDRTRSRKAIKKGLMVEADMEVPNSIWMKIAEIRNLRELKEYGGWK
jgi:hypothetical protein